MDEKNNTAYRIPQGFNPFMSIDHVRALTDAVHQLVTIGEMTTSPPSSAAVSNLVSLMELLQPEVHALHDYLGEVENLTNLKLPLTDEDFEADFVEKDRVKETRAVYAIS